ncbi:MULTISPECIES: hypothetical protein [unclassified Streptomyces]|uniref:hypothetical protein n=1 Tax=unclassified Streptomyces TaxID=2593676 RepID=UPI0022AEC3EA|nr:MULTISPECIES: hypothetical protein [unclassified Streptomyces]MCZ4097315.1 hypothetical protein [Streptomyces sp. H39-C1]MCZ4120619.1 hypothetical protein [Streptomyces sp. H39-S7]
MSKPNGIEIEWDQRALVRLEGSAQAAAEVEKATLRIARRYRSMLARVNRRRPHGNQTAAAVNVRTAVVWIDGKPIGGVVPDADVPAGASHAMHLEYGTDKTPAYHFLREAVARERRSVE